MKAIKKFFVLMMAAVLCLGVFGTFAGCDEGSKIIIDKTKTQIYVFNFSGGFGVEWLDDNLIQRFEEDYKDYPGLDGKVGVQVITDNQKITGTGVLSSMSGNKNYVLFTEGVNYQDFVSQGVVLDLTDMVTETLTEYGETRSILDKMTPAMQEALKVDTKDGDDRIYMIPHYAGYNGITLDIDLMNAKKMFLGENGRFNFVETDKAPAGYTGASNPADSRYLSAGQDGVFGTYDDGLPATYEEFFNLVIELNSVATPFAWSGNYNWYVTQMLGGMAANAMGPQKAEAMYTFNKENFPVVKTNTIQVSTTNPWSISYETELVNVTEATGYETFRSPGFLTALHFIDTIVDNGYFSNSSFTGGVMHTDIQDEFLQSRLDTEAFDKPVAMLIEGCWWEQEAAQTLKDLDDYYGDCGRMDRKLRFLPFPQVDESAIGQGQVLLEANNAYGFINAKTPVEYQEISLAFLQYCNTDASLREFTRVTNTSKALNYTVTEEDKAAMSYFGRSIMDIQSAPGTTIVYPMANNSTFWSKKNNLAPQDIFKMSTTVGTPSAYFKESSSNNAKTYFTNLCNYWKTSW